MTRLPIIPLLLAAVFLFSGAIPATGQDGFLRDLFSGDNGRVEKPGERRFLPQRGERRHGWLRGGPKRVEIDLTNQTLHAYEGNRVILRSRISSGRGRITPTGNFTAGPYMAENHYSSLYNNAHMPWSVQVKGNIFIHGFAEVPDHPASKGCIRLPITGNNPAKRFYQWVDVGTPIRIFY